MVSNFDSTSTAEQVLDSMMLSGKVVFLTGASSGIGIETARVLVARGAHVIGAVRDIDAASKAAIAVFEAEAKGGKFELVQVDLGALESVRACAQKLLRNVTKIDLVIANAGVMGTALGRTVDGFETQLGINHLGHFVLVNQLAPLMRSGSRLVVLSSLAHRISDIKFDDINFENTEYDPMVAYGQSKTANALFAVEFDRRHKARGVRACAVHPGAVNTQLGRYMDPMALAGMYEYMNALLSAKGRPPFQPKTVEQGAATSIWAGIIAPAELIGGQYCEDCHVSRKISDPAEVDLVDDGVLAYALNGDAAAKLWHISEAMVGEVF